MLALCPIKIKAKSPQNILKNIQPGMIQCLILNIAKHLTDMSHSHQPVWQIYAPKTHERTLPDNFSVTRSPTSAVVSATVVHVSPAEDKSSTVRERTRSLQLSRSVSDRQVCHLVRMK